MWENIRRDGGIPIEGIERTKDKLTRSMDVQSYYKIGSVCLPPDDQQPMLQKYKRFPDKNDESKYEWVSLKNAEPWVPGFISEHESFTPDDTHRWDDQIDPVLDAVGDMLGIGNTLSIWSKLGK